MKYKKENLTKLLLLIEEICDDPNNRWFRDAIVVNNNPSSSSKQTEKEQEIINDLKRSKFYLNSIDKKNWTEALNYYSEIKFPDLKLQLSSDYKEMKIADKNDDIVEFARRIVMQLENCINTVCILCNAYKVIKENETTYIDKKMNLVRGEYSFFKQDFSPREINKISINSKIFFVKQFYGINYSFIDLNEMVTIRNKSSHRGEFTEREKEIISKAKSNITERKSSYFKCFDSIYSKLIVLKIK